MMNGFIMVIFMVYIFMVCHGVFNGIPSGSQSHGLLEKFPIEFDDLNDELWHSQRPIAMRTCAAAPQRSWRPKEKQPKTLVDRALAARSLDSKDKGCETTPKRGIKNRERAARPQLPIGPIRLTVTSFPNSFLYLTQPAKASLMIFPWALLAIFDGGFPIASH